MTSRLLILNCSKNQHWSREFVGSFCWFLSEVKVPLSLVETPSVSSLSGLTSPIELLCTSKAVGSVAAVSVTILNSSTFSAHLGSRLPSFGSLCQLVLLPPSWGWDLPVFVQKIPTTSDFQFTDLHSHKALYDLAALWCSRWIVFYSLRSVQAMS